MCTKGSLFLTLLSEVPLQDLVGIEELVLLQAKRFDDLDAMVVAERQVVATLGVVHLFGVPQQVAQGLQVLLHSSMWCEKLLTYVSLKHVLCIPSDACIQFSTCI